jgi:SAM-dependent methyltransferase
VLARLRRQGGQARRRARAGLARWVARRANPLGLSARVLHEALAARRHYACGRLLDVGCGWQPHRALFGHVDRYVGVDGLDSGPVDLYGDGLALPFRDEVFDSVLCNQVLEHVPEPGRLLAEIRRVLRPGGTLLLTAPQTWGLHREPDDFYRYTKYGLRYLAERSDLAPVEIVPTCGLWATLAQRIVDTAVNIYAAHASRGAKRVLSLVLIPVLIVGYAIDRVVGKRGDTLDYLMIARRPW